MLLDIRIIKPHSFATVFHLIALVCYFFFVNQFDKRGAIHHPKADFGVVNSAEKQDIPLVFLLYMLPLVIVFAPVAG